MALRWEVPRGSDLIRTDPVKLKIVVRNLVGNALKFTKRGRVTVSVLFDARGRMLDVQVRDTGVGIPSEHLPHIFDMFHQAPSRPRAPAASASASTSSAASSSCSAAASAPAAAPARARPSR